MDDDDDDEDEDDDDDDDGDDDDIDDDLGICTAPPKSDVKGDKTVFAILWLCLALLSKAFELEVYL